MTTAHKITTVLALALAGFLACASYGWLKEREARIVVSAQEQADNASVAKLEADIASNKQELQAQLATFAQMKQTVQTPAQVVQALPQVINLPAPVVQLTTAQAQAADASLLPDAPKLSAGDLVIPQASVKAFYDAQVDCKAQTATATSCVQTVKDDNAVVTAKDTEITQLQTALKGGTKWQRIGRSLKTVAIGAAIGVAAVEYEQHR